MSNPEICFTAHDSVRARPQSLLNDIRKRLLEATEFRVDDEPWECEEAEESDCPYDPPDPGNLHFAVDAVFEGPDGEETEHRLLFTDANWREAAEWELANQLSLFPNREEFGTWETLAEFVFDKIALNALFLRNPKYPLAITNDVLDLFWWAGVETAADVVALSHTLKEYYP